MNIRKTMYVTGFLHHLVYYYDYQEALFISLYACVRGRGLGCTKRTRKKNWLCYRLVLTLHYSISVKFIEYSLIFNQNSWNYPGMVTSYSVTMKQKKRLDFQFAWKITLLCKLYPFFFFAQYIFHSYLKNAFFEYFVSIDSTRCKFSGALLHKMIN